MALLYRVVVLGQPRGPWRGRKRQAEDDAIASGWGDRDDDGQVYLDALASIEWCRQEDFRLSA